MGTLIVICGLSFSGKSTLAKAITARLGYEEIDVDTEGQRCTTATSTTNG
jgi:shikimate kinase